MPVPPFVSKLLDWFQQNARPLPWRNAPTPYHVWLSEILLQQTRIAAVLEAYRHFLETYPTIEELAAGDDATLMKLWEGLGYYSRARNLKKCAQLVAERGDFPHNVEGLRQLPGIGPYTAGAIAAIAFNEPAVAVDGNVTRVLSRFLGRTLTREESAAILEPWLPAEKSGPFTQAWMELGEVICLPHGLPKCLECPLRLECQALQTNRIPDLPAKPAKAQRKRVSLTVFHLTSAAGHIALRQRPAKGLLAGLWEFPNADSSLTEKEAREWLEEYGFTVLSLSTEMPTHHIFTHIEWQMTNYAATVAEELPSFTWGTRQELASRYAIPTAFRQPKKN